MNPFPAVAVRGLVKRFGDAVAVAGIDLTVPAGSLSGLVGPNGAGKTTTLRMVTALLRPDAGQVVVDGIDVWADPVAAKARFGVLPDDLHLFERLTGAEFLSYLGLLRRLDPAVVAQRTGELLDVLGLSGDADKLVADYSQGMRKKVALGAALLHAPRVLFLDEPFESVDPLSARAIQDVLAHFRARGGTIVLSSHVMDVVERLCDHVAIIHRGRVVAAGTIDEVRGGERLEDVFVRAVGGEGAAQRDLTWLGPSVGPDGGEAPRRWAATRARTHRDDTPPWPPPPPGPPLEP